MNKPLMAKATAVWLVDNTTLSFKQIADFCGMHELEVQGIADGDVVTLGNTRGALRLHARAGSGQLEGTLVVESQWPNDAFIDGIGINLLVGAEPGFPGAGAAYHDTAVWLRPA